MKQSDRKIIQVIFFREFAFRYRRSLLGVGWTLINPLLTSLVLWIVFAHKFGEELSKGQKYAPFLVAGNLVQTYFSQGLISASNSLTDNSVILSKIRIKPQLFIISYSLTGLVNFVAGFVPLAITCLLSEQSISLFSPISLYFAFLLSLLIMGFSLLLAPLIVKFQDMRNILVFVVSLSMFVTPVFYPINSLPNILSKLVILNPLNSILNGLRWSFSGNSSCSIFDVIYPLVVGLIFFMIGNYLIDKNWKKLVILL